jgi:hypothetical protein
MILVQGDHAMECTQAGGSCESRGAKVWIECQEGEGVHIMAVVVGVVRKISVPGVPGVGGWGGKAKMCGRNDWRVRTKLPA